MRWVYYTGGREKYYKAVHVGDCVVRAIAIANSLDYKFTYKIVKIYNGGETPRNGVWEYIYKELLRDMGWKYVNLCDRKLEPKGLLMNEDNLPCDKTIICSIEKHLVAVVDGVVHDTFDSSHKGTQLLRGYWVRKE